MSSFSDPDRWRRAMEIFNQAVELSTGARESFVLTSCGADEALRQQVAQLLASDQQADKFLEESPIRFAANEPVRAGEMIGAYRVVREIGRGGMGAVYLAERADGEFAQQVAIKIIHPALEQQQDWPEVLRRFQSERQILATLNHPNIARLIDGGTLPDGRPYFAMEYVSGHTIEVFCRQRNLSANERLTLFQTVCHAVHYAHQRLVIHRDLKPSNILVTDDGTVKLLDFGIARLYDAGSGHATITALRPLTPAYASPEQLRSEPITMASDVYSLGVILYELLAGQHPYDSLRHNLPELIRAINEAEPLKPSLAAQTPSEKPISHLLTATWRLGGDTDRIVLRALHKEPARRYSSAENLAADIHRYLSGLPVTARPDTLWYRTTKFLQRNRALSAVLLLLLVSLVFGTVSSYRQAARASQQRQIAERRFNQVRALASSFVFRYHDEIAGLPGATRVRAMLVQDATNYLDQLASEAGNDAALIRELALAYQKLGDVQGRAYDANLGDSAGALQSYQKAVALLESLRDQQAVTQAEVLESLLTCYHRLSSLLARLSRFTETTQVTLKALTTAERLAALEPDNRAYELKLAEACLEWGDKGESETSGKLTNYSRSLQLAQRLSAAAPDNPAVLTAVIRAEDRIGRLYLRLGHENCQDKKAAQIFWQNALLHCRALLSLTEKRAALEPENYIARRSVIVAQVNLSEALRASNQPDEALSHASKALLAMQQIVASDLHNVEARTDLAEVLQAAGDCDLAAGKTSSAQEKLQAAQKILADLTARDPGNEELKTLLKKVRAKTENPQPKKSRC
ncbi:MAG: protein kinase [Blastocatellia bacterium]